MAQAPASLSSDQGLSAGASVTRMAGDWRSTAAVAIPDSVPPVYRTALDQGSAPPNQRLDRMLLLLAPSAVQQQALTTELGNLQNPASPNYHRWLSPASFADAYANSPSDTAAISAWLQSQGFKVAPLPAGRGWIEFSGTVAQVEQAFQTQIDTVATAAGTRAVLTSGISVPAALSPLVQGLVSLDGALSLPAQTTPRPIVSAVAELAAQTSPAIAEAFTPQIVTQLLRLDSLSASGINGAGQTIAIAARSNIVNTDVDAFRSAFALPAMPLKIVLNGEDPGLTGDQGPATLAASWAGAAAPGAQIILVPAATTAATDGMDLSLAAIVDQVLARTVAVGYSSCEAGMSAAHQAFYSALYQQAAAEGISVIAASGDSGASACHLAGSDTPVSSGYAVNALASTPWNTAVGVAAFGEVGPSAGNKALSAWSPASAADPAYAGGGGSSAFYAAPAWQPIPAKLSGEATHTRLLPDVALPTAIDTGVNHGLAFCLSGSAAASSGCTLVRSGGSSAAAALFAGIAALVAQKNGTQGNLAPNLYALGNRSGVFNDVQQGGAQLKCAAGSPGCGATEQIGYTAATGYDLATGLGSIDGSALVNQWAVSPQVGTDAVNVSLVISPTQINATYNPSALITLSSTVLSLTGHGTPTGTVTFFDNSTAAAISAPSALDGTGTATLTTEGVFAAGGNEMVAIYNGNTTYESVTSTPPININIQDSTTSLAVVPSNYTPASGSTISVLVTLTVGSPVAGSLAPTGLIRLNLDGLPTTAALLTTTGGVTSATLSLLIPVSSSLHTHALQATYAGDTNYSASTSPPVTVTVATSGTTSVVTPATTTPYATNSLVLTATVAPGATGATAPTGTFTFTLDGVAQGTATLVPGLPSTATLAIIVPAGAGTHTVGGTYNGDTNNSGSTATSVTITVSKGPTTLALVPATSTPAPGAPLQVTANLTESSPGAAIATGTVTFTMDGVNQGTASVVSGTAATLTITAPAAGTHTLQATYAGDNNYSGSTAPTVTITVSKVVTTVVVVPSTTTPAAGSAITVSATLTPASTLSSLPSGTITFSLDGVTQTTVPLGAGSPSTTTTTITAPTSGTHLLTATYNGDTYYATSTSTAVSLTVTKTATTTVVVPSTTTPASGSSLQVTATITPTAYGSSLPTGTVTFTVDGATQGVQNVTSGTPTTATITFTVSNVGTHTLQATYSGDNNYASSTATSVLYTVSKTATTLTLSPSTATPTAGTTLQVTANVYPSATLTTLPTGTVTYTLDGVNVASANVVSGSPATATVSFTVPTAGAHTLQATYGGDTIYSASSATALTLNVSKSTPTVVVTPATQTPTAGSTLLISAAISPSATGASSPTGIVTFTLDGTNIGTTGVVAGSPSTASITISTPSIGTHTIQANYGGDGNYNATTSAGVTIAVTKGNTTLAITPATTTPLGGSNMQVTATVAATIAGTTVPTGIVNFTLDGASVGNGTISGGTTASINITVPSTGTHALQASYAGDTNFNGSVAPPVNITVARTPTTIVITPSTTTPALGSTLPVTATVTPSSFGSTMPSGSVTFTVDGVTVGIQTVTAGLPSTATFTYPAFLPGAHLLAATYSGDTYYANSTATAVTVTVPKSPVSMTITPATTTPAGGASLAVTATITATTPGTTLPTGSVTFSVDGVSAGIVGVVPGTPATAATVILSTIVTPGTHILQATYSGDTYYSTATAPAVTITVAKSPSTISITPSTLTPTAGGSMVVTAYITSSSPAATQPTGIVTITEDGSTVGVGTVVAGAPSIATITLPMVSAGSHILQGSYSGDTFYTASNSATVPIVAAKGTTVTTVTATPAALTAGVTETLTATIAPTNPVTGTVYTITGTVSFYDGGTTLLGKVSVAANTATITGISLKDNVNHTITAIYSGDTNWLGSSSSVLPLDATTLPDYVVLTSNFSVAQPGAAIVLTATVTPAALPAITGEQNPTGTVVFYNGTTVIGTSQLTAVALGDTAVATLTTQTLPGGQDTVYAYYQGDLYYDAATSNLLTLTVEDFTITPASTNPSTNLTIVQGSSGSATYVITGSGGFNNQVQVVCAVPSQDNMTCTASPQQVVPTGTVTFVVQTFTSATTLAGGVGSKPIWMHAAGGAALGALGFFLLPFGRRSRNILLKAAGNTTRSLLVLVLLLVALVGTGIGCTSSTGLAPYGTPLGVAILKITGSAYVDNTVVSHSLYLTVNVVAK